MVDKREHGAVSAKKATTTIGGANDAGTETERGVGGGEQRETRRDDDARGERQHEEEEGERDREAKGGKQQRRHDTECQRYGENNNKRTEHTRFSCVKQGRERERERGEEPMKQTNKQAAHRESREVRGGACARFDRIGQAGGHGSDSYRHSYSYSYSYRMLTYDAYRTRNNGTRETKDGAQQMSLTHSNRPRERGRESAPSSSLSFLFLFCISI